MIATLDFVMECALEHPILEERKKELATFPSSKDTLDHRTAITALHSFHNGNILSPLAQIDKIEVYSRLLSNEVLQHHSQVPLFGELNRNPARGINNIVRGQSSYRAPSLGQSIRAASMDVSTPPQAGRSTDNTLPSDDLDYDDGEYEEDESREERSEDEGVERHSIVLDDGDREDEYSEEGHFE